MKKLSVAALFAALFFCCGAPLAVYAVPFYDLDPKPIVLRAEFSTSYASSGEARKHNVALAAKALDGALVASGEEFSFNARVGERSAERGYREAKIIVGGKFAEGVGGGVCQVSTTLYNAVLLAGLRVTESHPHSLQVGYVSAGADAMVNYYFADLRFVNDTKNPVYLETKADGSRLIVRVYGEALKGRIALKSRVVGEIAPEEKIVVDTAGEYPDLYKGERRIVRYGKAGVKSELYLLRYSESGALTEKILLRKDRYLPIDTVIAEGTAEPPAAEEGTDLSEIPPNTDRAEGGGDGILPEGGAA